MALLDVRTYGQNRLKKSISLSTATIDVKKITTSHLNPNPGELKQNDKIILFDLPPQALVTSCFLINKKGPTTKNAKFKLLVENTEIMAEQTVGDTNAVSAVTTNKFFPTGGLVAAEVTTADLSEGVYEICVEYYEIKKFTGEYTN